MNMNNRDWIKQILQGKSEKTAQHWMSFFNADTARKIASKRFHYDGMSLYDARGDYDMSGMSEEDLDKLIGFNEYTGRVFACLGKGANIMFGHGGPGEFFCRRIEEGENHIVVEYETGVKNKIQFKPHFHHYFDHPVKDMASAMALELPDPNDQSRYEGLKHNAECLRKKDQYVLGSVNGFFSGIHYFLMDYQETLMAIIAEPKLIETILEKLGNWNLTASENMFKAGVDCLAVCDDLGSKQNLLMSPEDYRRLFKPWHKRLCELAHSYGGTVHLHSHGAIHPLLDDLVECGFDFINPFDPEEGFDIENVLDNYSDKFVVVGGFPADFWYWQQQKQRQYLEKMAALGTKYPRFIFMDSGGVPDDITAETYMEITQMSEIERNIEKENTK
jgi:uroporphyrinogen-III decarboxylase